MLGVIFSHYTLRTVFTPPPPGTKSQAELVAADQWNVSALAEKADLGVTADAVETYRKLAKFNYDCGDYQTARDMLENYLTLFASPPKPDADGDEDDGVDDRRDRNGRQEGR